MKVDNYQSWAKDLFGGTCYAACISYTSGKDDPIDITRDILNGIEKGFVELSGYVSKPHLFYNCCFGKEIAKDIRKVAISKISDIPSEPTIVEMEQPNGKDSHFVICHFDGKNVVLDFDPSGISNSWKRQKFVSYRKFIK